MVALRRITLDVLREATKIWNAEEEIGFDPSAGRDSKEKLHFHT